MTIIEKLEKLLKSMKESQKIWCAEEVDDAEEMWEEYPDFLDSTIPIIEECINELKKEGNFEKND